MQGAKVLRRHRKPLRCLPASPVDPFVCTRQKLSNCAHTARPPGHTHSAVRRTCTSKLALQNLNAHMSAAEGGANHLPSSQMPLHVGLYWHHALSDAETNLIVSQLPAPTERQRNVMPSRWLLVLSKQTLTVPLSRLHQSICWLQGQSLERQKPQGQVHHGP